MTGIDWMIDMEIGLAKALGWSLRDIEETNAESLMLFFYRLTRQKVRTVYADQVEWL